MGYCCPPYLSGDIPLIIWDASRYPSIFLQQIYRDILRHDFRYWWYYRTYRDIPHKIFTLQQTSCGGSCCMILLRFVCLQSICTSAHSAHFPVPKQIGWTILNNYFFDFKLSLSQVDNYKKLVSFKLVLTKYWFLLLTLSRISSNYYRV